MKTLNVTSDAHPHKETILAQHANGFFSRLRGLLGRKALATNEGLLISPCSQIHTLGMRFAIDVVFINKEGQVLAVRNAVAPARAASCKGARHVLELAAGSAAHFNIKKGDTLHWAPIEVHAKRAPANLNSNSQTQ